MQGSHGEFCRDTDKSKLYTPASLAEVKLVNFDPVCFKTQIDPRPISSLSDTIFCRMDKEI
jgi:hypothetical protein